MKKIVAYVLSLMVCALILCGCTDNQRAKKFGGTVTKTLPAGQKLMGITWKEDNMWYLTRPMRDDEKAEEYSFHEISNMGVFEGTVIIKEVTKSN